MNVQERTIDIEGEAFAYSRDCVSDAHLKRYARVQELSTYTTVFPACHLPDLDAFAYDLQHACYLLLSVQQLNGAPLYCFPSSSTSKNEIWGGASYPD